MRVDDGEGPQKQFYEDPSLAEDEHKLAEAIEEKRRIEEALNPMSLDFNTPASMNQSLSKMPSPKEPITPADGKLESDLKPVVEEEDK